MTRRGTFTALAAWMAVAVACGMAQAAAPPVPEVRTLANGLTVAVFPDTRLPLVQIQLLVPAGSAHEATGESGIAGLTAQMLGQGTTSRSAREFAEAVEALGGTLGGNAFRDFTTVNGTFLADDFRAGLELLADAVIHPILAEDRMRLVKSQMAGSLARAAQTPQTLAEERAWSEVFPGHPLGRSPLGARGILQALTLNQIRGFHRDFFRPDGALLAIAGDVTAERAFRAVESHLGAWGGRSREIAIPEPPRSAGGTWRVRLVDAPGLTRAELRVGMAGPSRSASDYAALDLAVELLNAALPATRARLHPLREAGLVMLAASVPVDSAGAVIRGVRAALERAAASAPEGAALETVKRRLAARQALAYETRGGWIAQWMSAAFHGLTPESPAEYGARLRGLDGAAVREAARRWLGPAGMVLVAVGPAERLRAQLEPLGSVEIIAPELSVEVPALSPSTDTTPPTEAQVARGRELAGRMVAAHGGVARLRRIHDSTMEGAVVIHAGGREFPGEFLQVRKEPMRFLFSTRIAVVYTMQGLEGDRGWSQTGERPAHIEDQDSVGVAALRSAFRSDLHHLLLMAADSTTRVAWRGRDRLEAGEADALEIVSGDGARRVLFLDPANHRLVGMEQGEGGHSARRLYSDYRDVNGIQWPFREERLLDGRPAMTLALERVAFNTGVRDERFRRPGAKPAPPRPR